MGGLRLALAGALLLALAEAAAAAELKASTSAEWPSSAPALAGDGGEVAGLRPLGLPLLQAHRPRPLRSWLRHGRWRAFGLARPRLLIVLGEVGIDRRRHEQGEDRADGHAGGDHHADIEAAGGARALGDQQRHHGHHHGRRGHQDRPQPDGGRLLDRLAPAEALAPPAACWRSPPSGCRAWRSARSG